MMRLLISFSLLSISVKSFLETKKMLRGAKGVDGETVERRSDGMQAEEIPGGMSDEKANLDDDMSGGNPEPVPFTPNADSSRQEPNPTTPMEKAVSVDTQQEIYQKSHLSSHSDSEFRGKQQKTLRNQSKLSSQSEGTLSSHSEFQVIPITLEQQVCVVAYENVKDWASHDSKSMLPEDARALCNLFHDNCNKKPEAQSGRTTPSAENHAEIMASTHTQHEGSTVPSNSKTSASSSTHTETGPRSSESINGVGSKRKKMHKKSDDAASVGVFSDPYDSKPSGNEERDDAETKTAGRMNVVRDTLQAVTGVVQSGHGLHGVQGEGSNGAGSQGVQDKNGLMANPLMRGNPAGRMAASGRKADGNGVPLVGGSPVDNAFLIGLQTLKVGSPATKAVFSMVSRINQRKKMIKEEHTNQGNKIIDGNAIDENASITDAKDGITNASITDAKDGIMDATEDAVIRAAHQMNGLSARERADLNSRKMKPTFLQVTGGKQGEPVEGSILEQIFSKEPEQNRYLQRNALLEIETQCRKISHCSSGC